MGINKTSNYEVPAWVGDYVECDDNGGTDPIITVIDSEISSLDIFTSDMKIEGSIWGQENLTSLDDAKRCAAAVNKLVARWEELERDRPQPRIFETTRTW